MIRVVDIRGKELPNVKDRTEGVHSSQLNGVKEIIDNIIKNGDCALFEYTKKFDGVEFNCFSVLVSDDEIREAYDSVDDELVQALRRAGENIFFYHQKQMKTSWMDIQKDHTVGQLVLPLQSVGVYVPGGTAAYPSTVMMNVMPAKVAGVKDIVMVSPPNKDGKLPPLTLVAAIEAGVDRIFKVGGAQAIAALAYGTETMPKVDKIVGPGNIYVALAKQEVFGQVGIDMIAGPSEVVVVADDSARADFVAADMLSQAEHDVLASAMLITDSESLASSVASELDAQLKKLPRNDIASESIDKQGVIYLVENMDRAMDMANHIAPEHLELAVSEPHSLLGKVKNAGAVFLGHYSPEPLGDYYAGPNHVLPTSGTARFFSPLGVDQFIKMTSVIDYSKAALKNAADDIDMLATAEGLAAHARSITIRFDEED